jgi:hypothetical protein
VWPVACLSKPRPQPLNKSQVAPFKRTRTGECERRLSCPSPSDAPKGWTSRPSRPKMHVQPSNHHRPSVRRVGPARQKPRRRIDPVEGGPRWRPLGRIPCTVNGVRREAEAEPRLLIDYFLRESLELTNIVKAIQSAAGAMRGPAGA